MSKAQTIFQEKNREKKALAKKSKACFGSQTSFTKSKVPKNVMQFNNHAQRFTGPNY